jgi:hypothetical protein
MLATGGNVGGEAMLQFGPRGMRRAVGAILLVSVFAAACQVPGRVFPTTLTSATLDPLPVTLTDQTGLVTAIAPEPDAQVQNEPMLQAVDGEPMSAVLTWLGGACDADTTVLVHRLDGGLVMNVAIHGKLGLGCVALGVPRAIRITTSEPLPIDQVTVAGG